LFNYSVNINTAQHLRKHYNAAFFEKAVFFLLDKLHCFDNS